MEFFYTLPENVHDNVIKLGVEEARHISRVLRHKVGDRISVVDGQGNEYSCSISVINRDSLTAEIIAKTRLAREPIVEVTLGAGIIKGNKLDPVAEMATELGVRQIVPLITERTVANVTALKLLRMRMLSVAALKSSTRTLLPEIKPPMPFAAFLSESSQYDLKLIAWEDERQSRLDDVVTTRPRRVALIIGPEGGFPEHEIALARNHGFLSFSMGPRRLRAETACIAALTMVLYQLREI